MKVFEENIKGNEIYPFNYLEYYNANIQGYMELEGTKIYDGITVDEFKHHYSNGFLELGEINKLINDKRLEKLQEELLMEGKRVCVFNMYILCMYLVMKAKTHYVILLEPTVEDLIEKDFTSITYNYDDGTSVKSTMLIDKIKELLTQKKERNYKVEKVVTWDEISNKALVNSFFVHDLAEFLHGYFPVKRKKDALVSTKEVELILYMLKLMGLVPEEPTNKRFWQLLAYYDKVYLPINENFIISSVRDNGKDIAAVLCFIPYKIWSAGKIDWQNLQTIKLDIGDSIQFQLVMVSFYCY